MTLAIVITALNEATDLSRLPRLRNLHRRSGHLRAPRRLRGDRRLPRHPADGGHRAEPPAQAPRNALRAPSARHHPRPQVGAGGPAAHHRPHVGPPLPALLRGGPRAATPLVLLTHRLTVGDPGGAAMRLSGVWLPIITPFKDGEVDYAGYERLFEHYVRAGVSGVIPLGTTGESPTIHEAET